MLLTGEHGSIIDNVNSEPFRRKKAPRLKIADTIARIPTS